MSTVSDLRWLRRASLAEGTTLVALVLIAVPVRHGFGYPLATHIMGPLHGLAFVGYVWTVAVTAAAGLWNGREVARLLAVAVLPFGAFLNLRWLDGKLASLAAVGNAR